MQTTRISTSFTKSSGKFAFSVIWCFLTVNVIAADLFEPRQETLPVPPPQDAIVLLDSKGPPRFVSMDGKEINWRFKHGELVIVERVERDEPKHVVSQLHFRDAEVHVEFMLPSEGAGNSGIYLHGNYELQILNSGDKAELTHHDMGAVYGFHPPLVNACRPPGEWQVYDIRYLAPRRDAQGQITKEGSITAWLNGKKVQDNARVGEPRSTFHPYRYGSTPYLQEIWEQQKLSMIGPVFLQEHFNPVSFRNVWVRPLDDEAFFYKGVSESEP